jgi:agmatinase
MHGGRFQELEMIKLHRRGVGSVLDLLKGAAGRGRIAAMDFVEFMPERDVDGIGALTFARLITTALGVLVRQAA